MTKLEELTPAQRRALPLLLRTVGWSPFEAPKTGNGEHVRRDMIRRLEALGIARSYDLTRPGDDPIYGAGLSEEGKALVDAAREEIRSFARAWCIADDASSLTMFSCDACFDVWVEHHRSYLRRSHWAPSIRQFLYALEAVGRDIAKRIVFDEWGYVVLEKRASLHTG